MLLVISINTGNCPIKKTQEGLRSANYFAVFKHHTYQILKADGVATFVPPSPGSQSSGQHLGPKCSYTGGSSLLGSSAKTAMQDESKSRFRKHVLEDHGVY